ncbi:MAG TPA: phosphate ABC transporter permease PstA [Gaiellaceae bacterium]
MSIAPSLQASGLARRRLRRNRAAEVVATLAAGLALAVLGILVGSVFDRALPALSLDFFLKGPSYDAYGQLGGGIAPSLVGTLLLIAIAAGIAAPVGVLTAIWVSEFAPRRLGDQVKLCLDVLNGFPSIVIGIFVFGLAVETDVPVLGIGHHPSAWAGGFALAIIMLPLISRTTMEVLALVPNSLREASYALGVSKWRTVLSVVLPTGIGGIMTGTTLAIARAAGETAPLLFVCAATTQTISWDPSRQVNSIPITIFTDYDQAGGATIAWGAAFTLITLVLASSLTSRYFLDRSRRKLGQVG